MFRPSILFIILIAVIASCTKKKHIPLRETRLINEKWQYSEDPINERNINTDAASWEEINLPHTWNAFDVTDIKPGYRRDTSWYKKNIFIPSVKGKRVKLFFEGSNFTTVVYVNRKKTGEHIGGYTGFVIDITSAIEFGKENEILVRVDNSYNRDIVPSQKSDFFLYGGIIRDLWMQFVPENHIERINIKTPFVTRQEAVTSASILLNISEEAITNSKIIATIIDPNNKALTSLEQDVRERQTEILLPAITKPDLWSTDTPQLYRLQVELYQNGIKTDSVSEVYGYRWYSFEKQGPFYLNGKKVLLKGTHRHEEHAGFGGALPNSLHREDMKKIKEMGGNFVRLAHYPQDPVVYRMCDSLGIIVWDELPWCRGGVGGDTWKNNTDRLLKEMIYRNMNHPSIVFWSLGNEINWLPDFEGGESGEAISAFLKQLNDTAHKLDSARYTAIRKYTPAKEIVDVYSPSIWSGWYAGVYNQYEKALEESRKEIDHFLHMEYGGSSHVGRHTEHPISGEGIIKSLDWTEKESQLQAKSISNDGDWSESYIVDLFDWYLFVTEKTEWFAGSAQWSLKDFGTPVRPENPIPFVNQKGLLDRAGNPKDAFYVFKSYWTTNPAFVYIESHTWKKRNGAANKLSDLTVYSNCEEVELFLNGKSLGKKKKDRSKYPAHGLVWNSLFQGGENNVVAIGYVNNSQQCTDSISFEYIDKQITGPDDLTLSYRPLANGNLLIEATMRDYHGLPQLYFNDRIYFSQLSGEGELLMDYGSPTRSQVIEMANGYAAIEFKPVKGKKAVIMAQTDGTKGTFIEVSW